MSSLLPSDNFSKMMLFVFLGMLLLILVFGFHKSPQASKATGQLEAAARLSSASRTPTSAKSQTYPSNQRDY